MISKVIHINDSYNDGQDISCTLIENQLKKEFSIKTPWKEINLFRTVQPTFMEKKKLTKT